ncbi:hypothetical protein [Nocardia sp. NPDC057668]|uniref:hypothetical protein n=1 Tax=Nocardia sp. NPDC057668 TaxID=3346202 RepID=UPI00366FFCB1
MIKTGSRLESQVCEAQVIVVRTSAALDELRCGGVPMVPLGAKTDTGLSPDPEFAAGAVLGKRYVHDGAEVLVTKSGTGTLAVNGIPLQLKQAKQLPSSD